MKKMTIYLFASFFVMSLVSSAVAKITISSEFKYKTLPDEGTSLSCEDQGYLSGKPANSKCDTYKGCFRNCECLDGYVKVNGVCTLNDCSAYPLTGCNSDRGTVETCETEASKCRYSSCKNGFTLSNGNCVCNGSGVVESSGVCQCDYGEGWTTKNENPAPCSTPGCANLAPCQKMVCPLGSSTNPNCGTNEEASYTGDKSGGQKCYKCTCDSSTDTCTESAYPYTAATKPSTGTFENCTTKCGGVVRYRQTGCQYNYTSATSCGTGDGWSLVNDGVTLSDGTACKKCSCTEPYTATTCPTNASCKTGCSGKKQFSSCNTGYYDVDACYYDSNGTNFGPLSYWTAANMGL